MTCGRRSWTYEELSNKVKEYAWRRKLDTNAKKSMQQGGDPMNVGSVAGWDYDSDFDQDGVHAIGLKSKGEGKGGKG